MSLFRLPRQMHRLLTYLPRQAYLPYIRRTLRSEYEAKDLTPEEALLISANVAYDKASAAYLLRSTGKSAAQLAAENPKRKPVPNWRRRLKTWFMSLEGSEPLGKAYNRTLLPENRKDIVE